MLLDSHSHQAESVALDDPPPATNPLAPLNRPVLSSASSAGPPRAASTSPTVTIWSAGMGWPSGTETTWPERVRRCRRARRADRPAAHGIPRSVVYVSVALTNRIKCKRQLTSGVAGVGEEADHEARSHGSEDTERERFVWGAVSAVSCLHEIS